MDEIVKHRCGCWHTFQTAGGGGGSSCTKHVTSGCCGQIAVVPPPSKTSSNKLLWLLVAILMGVTLASLALAVRNSQPINCVGDVYEKEGKLLCVVELKQ